MDRLRRVEGLMVRLVATGAAIVGFAAMTGCHSHPRNVPPPVNYSNSWAPNAGVPQQTMPAPMGGGMMMPSTYNNNNNGYGYGPGPAMNGGMMPAGAMPGAAPAPMPYGNPGYPSMSSRDDARRDPNVKAASFEPGLTNLPPLNNGGQTNGNGNGNESDPATSPTGPGGDLSSELTPPLAPNNSLLSFGGSR